MSKNEQDSRPLPGAWEWATLGEISEVIAGNPAPQGERYFRGGKFPFVRVQDMGRLGSSAELKITKDRINNLAAKKLRLFPLGTVLFTKSGASTLLNQRAILAQDSYVVSHIAAAIPYEGIYSKWLYYWLKSVDFAKLAHATTLPSLPLYKSKTISVPVAPTKEQYRILSRIEELFSKLEVSVDALKRVQKLLESYRGSVLKAACEGRLVPTEAELSKKEGRDYEPASELIKRILIERRVRWAVDQLEKFKVRKSNQGWSDRKIVEAIPAERRKIANKYKEPELPVTSDLPDLPEGWCWASLESITQNIHQGWSPKCEQNPSPSLESWGVIKTTAVQHMLYDEDANKRLPKFLKPRPELEISAGDFLITRAGPRSRVGVCCLVRRTRPRLLLCDKVYRVRVSETLFDLEYLELCLNAPSLLRQLSELKTGISDSGVNLTQERFLKLPIPLPPKYEQTRIVSEVSRQVSVLDQVNKDIAEYAIRPQVFRQSILKRAFEGKLVSQDPKDEPADKLLERIRAEREAKQLRLAKSKRSRFNVSKP